MVSIPFGVILALQVGVLAQQVGAASFTGAGNTLAVVRQASPIITALMLSGVAGSAICSDIGARKIREELDALEVMGISVTERLVLPRALSTVIVAVLLNGIVMFFTIMTTLLISTVAMNLSPGSYLASVGALARPSDLLLSLMKAAIFGVICTIVAAHKGLTVTKGPAGVGDAVTDAVVMNFVLLFAANFVISQVMTAASGGGDVSQAVPRSRQSRDLLRPFEQAGEQLLFWAEVIRHIPLDDPAVQQADRHHPGRAQPRHRRLRDRRRRGRRGHPALDPDRQRGRLRGSQRPVGDRAGAADRLHLGVHQHP